MSQFTRSSASSEFRKKPGASSVLLSGIPYCFLNCSARDFQASPPAVPPDTHSRSARYTIGALLAACPSRNAYIKSAVSESLATLAAMTDMSWRLTCLLVTSAQTRGSSFMLTPKEWKISFRSSAWAHSRSWPFRQPASARTHAPSGPLPLATARHSRLPGSLLPPGSTCVTLSSRNYGRRAVGGRSWSACMGRYSGNSSRKMSGRSPFSPYASVTSLRTAFSSTLLLTRVQRSRSRMSGSALASGTLWAEAGTGALRRAMTPCHSMRQARGTPTTSLALQLSSTKCQLRKACLSVLAYPLFTLATRTTKPLSSYSRSPPLVGESRCHTEWKAALAAYWNWTMVASCELRRNFMFQSLTWYLREERSGSRMADCSCLLGGSVRSCEPTSTRWTWLTSIWDSRVAGSRERRADLEPMRGRLMRLSCGSGSCSDLRMREGWSGGWLRMKDSATELLRESCSGAGLMSCSSGLRMVSLGGGRAASSSASWRKPASFSPVVSATMRFFSSSSSVIHSLASCGDSHAKFHSTVSSSPLAFLPVCLTCMSGVLLGFLRVEVASGVETSFLGCGRLGAKGRFLVSLMQKRILRWLSQRRRRSLVSMEKVRPSLRTSEQNTVVLPICSWCTRAFSSASVGFPCIQVSSYKLNPTAPHPSITLPPLI